MKSLKKKLADDMLVLRGVNQPTTVIDVYKRQDSNK